MLVMPAVVRQELDERRLVVLGLGQAAHVVQRQVVLVQEAPSRERGVCGLLVVVGGGDGESRLAEAPVGFGADLQEPV